MNGLGVDFYSHGADSNGVGVDRFIAEANKAKSQGLHANPRMQISKPTGLNLNPRV